MEKSEEKELSIVLKTKVRIIDTSKSKVKWVIEKKGRWAER